MSGLLQAILGFPAVIFTVLLGVVLMYWLMAMLGAVDIEAGDVDADIDAVDMDTDADADIGTLASYVVAFGLNGVPISVAFSLIVLVGWTLAGIATQYINLLPGQWLRWGAGLVAMVAILAVSIVITAQLIRPLRKLFVTHGAQSNASLVGAYCVVLTGQVDTQQGRAEIRRRGAGINIRVWADDGNGLARGDRALVTEYDEEKNAYRIERV